MHNNAINFDSLPLANYGKRYKQKIKGSYNGKRW